MNESPFPSCSSNGCRVLPAIVALAVWLTPQARAQSYTNWPADPEWVALSNHIAWCFQQVAVRYAILGCENPPTPVFDCPAQDYAILTNEVDLLASVFWFVDKGKSQGGTFDSYFGTPYPGGGYPFEFPFYHIATLHQQAGFTNWESADLLQSWCCWSNASKARLLDQVSATLNLLTWTVADPWITGCGRKSGYGLSNNSFAEATSMATNDYQWRFPNDCLEAWCVKNRSGSTFSTEFARETIAVTVFRRTNVVADAQLYFATGLPYWSSDPEATDTYCDNGDGLTDSGELVICRTNVTFDSNVSECDVLFGQPDLNLPEEALDPFGQEYPANVFQQKGYAAWDFRGLWKWDAPGGLNTNAPPNPYAVGGAGLPAEDYFLPDTDRDEIADVGVAIDQPGPETGTIVFDPELGRATPVIPLNPGYFRGPPRRCPVMHAYLTLTPALPYQFNGGSGEDPDGYATSLSTATRILESAAIDTPQRHVKQVSLIRPHGQLVVFDFPYTNGAFSTLGYPMAPNGARTYVLRDISPESHADGNYELQFESGITHHFAGGTLCYVSNPYGDDSSVAGLGARSTFGSIYGAYTVDSTWANDRPTEISYVSSLDPGTSVHTLIAYDSGGAIHAVRKSGAAGIWRTDATSESQTIAYGTGITVSWSTSSAPRSARTVTLTTSVPDSGSFTRTFSYNAADYLTGATLTWNGTTAWVTNHYGIGTGRCANGALRSAKLASTGASDGRWREFDYDHNTGWLIESTGSTAFGPETFALSYDLDVQGYTAADTNLLVALPRRVATLVGPREVSRTYTAYGYNGSTLTGATVRAMLAPGLPWTGDHLAAECEYDGYGHLALVRTAVDTNHYEFSAWGFSGALSHQNASTFRCLSFSPWGDLSADWNYTEGEPYIYSTTGSTDAFGRPLETSYQDGTSREVLAYDWSGPTQITERDGSTRTITRDGLGRVRQASYLGRVWSFDYDPFGRVTWSAFTKDGQTVERRRMWDADGRLVSDQTPLGTTTNTYALQNNQWTVTSSTPGHGNLVQIYHADGTLLQVGGPGAVEHTRFTHGVESFNGQNLRYVRRIACATNDADTDEWSKTYFDALGRQRYAKQSGTDGFSQFAYDDAKGGRFDSTTDELGRKGMVAYDEKNRILKSGLNRDGITNALSENSADRIWREARGVGWHTTFQYTNETSAVSNLFSKIEWASSGKTVTFAGPHSTNILSRGNPTLGGVLGLTNATLGGLSTAIHFAGGVPDEVKMLTTAGTADETWQLGHDRFDLPAGATNNHGVAVEIERDTAGRVTQIDTSTGNDVSFTYYAGTPWVHTRTVETGDRVTNTYYPNGLVETETGDTLHTHFEYDGQGRLVALNTYQGTNQVATEWVYHGQTGRLQEKRVNGKTVERYDWQDNGELQYATNAVGYRLAASYDAGGDLTGYAFSDGKTPNLTFTVARMGGIKGAAVAGGIAESYGLNLDGERNLVTVAGNTVVKSHALAYYRLPGGGGISQVAFDPGQVRAINIGYDTARRANQVTDGAVQATYTRAGNAPAVGQIVLKVSGVDRLTANYSYNGARQMVTNVAWSAGGTNVASFGYGLATNAPRIARLSMPDGTRWDYAYDAIGQLVGATQRLASGAAVAGRTFAYTNDTIGNAVRAGPVEGGAPLYRFTVTNDNFQVRRVWSNLVEVTGTAQTNATVSVFLRPYGPIVTAARQGERFRALLAVSNAASAIWQPIQVIAVRQEGTNDFVQLTDGSFYLPKADETVVRAEGAYVLVDSRWAYTWDWAGKLLAAESSHRAQNQRLTFDYYPDGRRARKIVSVWTNSAWQAVQTNRFCYDRWNPIEEEIRTSGGMVTNRYTWGLDLAGQWSGQYEQEAGGIGGLLAVTVASGGVERVYLPIADAKGNIRHLWDATSNAIAATYDYDPFGRLIGKTGAAADACPFRFSSKYLDEETGLYYYGYRYYDPCSLKWLSRDPLGEQGGLNLTAFCGNDPVNQVDPLGLEPNNEWYSVSTFIPQPQPPPLPPLAPQPKCWIQNARSPRQQADVPVMRDYAREKVKYFQQCNALVPSALRGTPVADQLMEIQSEAVLSAFAQPAIAFGCAKFGQFFRIGRLMTGAERVSLTEARAIEALGTPLRTAPITWASPLETGVNLYHATPATAARVQGLLSGIDPKFLQNPYNRFGPAFYVSERGGGAFAEVVANGHSPLYEIRYSLNTARMAVLDLTDPEMALAWGYSGGPVSSATQAIGTRARRCGFNVIRFKSIRGSGFNLAVLSEFNDILVPEMIFPIP